jgi:hypothetical protein
VTYDVKCWELAVAFVHDVERPAKTRKELADELAQVIQRAIEDWMEDQKPKEPNPQADQSCQLNSESEGT